MTTRETTREFQQKVLEIFRIALESLPLAGLLVQEEGDRVSVLWQGAEFARLSFSETAGGRPQAHLGGPTIPVGLLGGAFAPAFYWGGNLFLSPGEAVRQTILYLVHALVHAHLDRL